MSAQPGLADAGTLLSLGLGLGVGGGLILILSALRRRSDADHDEDEHPIGPSRGSAGWLSANRRETYAGDRTRLILVALGAAIVVAAATRWPVAAVVAGLAVWALPGILGAQSGARERVARVEAIASWTEMLRDTLAAAAGLEQAIIVTADTAPAAIRPQVQALRERLQAGEGSLAAALREFADELDDSTADLVVVALVSASQHQSRQLGDLLASLAVAARDQVTMRLRVQAGRASTRTSVRIIVATTILMAIGMVALNRSYLKPYDGAAGQLVLSLILLVFGVALWWLGRIADAKEPARVLTNSQALSVGAGARGQERSSGPRAAAGRRA